MYVNEYSIFEFKHRYGNIHVISQTSKKIAAGDQGNADFNEQGIESPSTLEFEGLQIIINSYKSFGRNNLYKNVRGSILKNFAHRMEENIDVQRLFTTEGFFNELELIENQYIRLKPVLDFVPYIESLQSRIEKYSKNVSSHDENTLLRFLYAATLSKLAHLKYNENRVSVVDLVGYLNVVEANVDRLRKIERAADINNYRNEYQKNVDDKIKQARELIKNEIIPKIHESQNKTFKEIEVCIKEIKELVHQEEKAIAKLIDKRDTAKHLSSIALWGNIFNAIAAFFAMIVAFGTFGTSNAKVSPKGNLKSNSIGLPYNNYDNNYRETRNQLYQDYHKLNESITLLREAFAQEHKLYLEQLNKVFFHLQNYNTSWADKIRKVATEHKGFIENELNQKDVVLDPSEANQLRRVLYGLVKNVESPKGAAAVFFGVVAVLGGLLAMTGTIMATIAKDQEDREAIAALNEEIDEHIKRKQDLEDVIFHLFTKAKIHVESLQKELLQIRDGLDKQMDVELDITKWNIQGMLNNLKSDLRKVLENTVSTVNLERNIERIEEAMVVLINVYDRIQSYYEKKRFADYYGSLLSDKPEIVDPNLNSMKLRVEKIIQMNRVLEQHENAARALKQHYFPFPSIYSNLISLPSIDYDDIATTTRRMIYQVTFMREQVQLEKFTVGKYDREVFSNVSNMTLFQWKADMFDIEEYLSGKEIMLYADVRKGISQNAVKVNRIEFALKIDDAELQLELDTYLSMTSTVVSMIGNSYYKCNDEYYYISIDDNLVFEYSNQKRQNSDEPLIYNEVYRKIEQSGYFISPYTLWKVQLIPYFQQSNLKYTKHQIKSLAKKLEKNGATLNLIARSQFFRGGIFTPEICTANLDNFYHRDKSESHFESIDHLRLRNVQFYRKL